MTDSQLTIGAMAFEIGIPTVLLFALFVAPKFRPMCYSVLGALTPLLFTYVSAVVSTWNVTNPDEIWAVEALWIMSFAPYIVAMVIGILLGLVPKPKMSALRFSFSAIFSMCVLWIFLSFA